MRPRRGIETIQLTNELLKTIERIESEKLLLDLAIAGIAAMVAAQPASIVRRSMSLEPPSAGYVLTACRKPIHLRISGTDGH